ncbi:S8 family serine peptidase [Bacillus sp. SL00103]
MYLLCAQRGNEGDGDERTEEFSYPAKIHEVIAVGSVSLQENPLNSPTPIKKSTSSLQGEDILSTLPNHKYGRLTGTSMAAPHVSGALAIIKNAEEEAFQRKLSEPEVYAQLVRRTLPLKQSKALVGMDFYI